MVTTFFFFMTWVWLGPSERRVFLSSACRYETRYGYYSLLQREREYTLGNSYTAIRLFMTPFYRDRILVQIGFSFSHV